MEPPKPTEPKTPADAASPAPSGADAPTQNEPVTFPGTTVAVPDQGGLPGPTDTPDPATDTADGPGEILNPSAAASPMPSEPAAPAPLPPAPVDTPSNDADPAMPAATVVGGSAMGGAGAAAPKKRTLFKALIVGGIVALLASASAAAYFGYYVPHKPENILKAALAKTLTDDSVKSGYFEGSLGVSDSQSEFELTVNFEGKGDESGRFQVQAEVDAVVTKATVEARSVDGKTFYAKLGGLSGLPELLAATGDPSLEGYGTMLASLDEQWIEINESLIKSIQKSADLSVSEADIKKLVDMYKKHNFIKVKEVLPSATIKGMNSYHYKVVGDKAELKAFYQEIKNANLKSFKLPQEELDQTIKEVESANFDKYPVDVWIDKSSKLINQLAVEAASDSDDTKINVTLTLFDFNKPVTVEKPEGAKSILDVMGGFFGGASSGTLPTESMFLDELEDSGISL